MTSLRQLVKALTPPAALAAYHRLDPERGERVEAQRRRLAERERLAARPLESVFDGIGAVRVTFPASQIRRRRDMVAPLAELLTLSAICRYLCPERVLEIGTYVGSTTLLLAMNSPERSEIVTIDLDPAARGTHVHGLGVGQFEPFEVGSAFRGQPEASRIRQVYGDSRTVDRPALGTGYDVVFVDADHTYEFVKADTALAFAVLKPGGMIIWDDYYWDEAYPECAGVTRVVNELAETLPCFRIAGTRLAIHVDSGLATAP